MKRASLDAAESVRRSAQARFDQQCSAADRNHRGQFATPTQLALDMVSLAKVYLAPEGAIRFLDPGVGTGVFFYAARKILGGRRLRRGTGFETDPELATVAERLWSPFGLRVRNEDFCVAASPAREQEKFNLILCNPPYVRHHHFSAGRKAMLRRIVSELGIEVSGLAGLYCYFLLLAHRWLARGGLGVWIVPAEFIDVNYGRALKEYLTRTVTLLHIHRFDPQDVQFADALVTSVVIAFVNAPVLQEHRVQLTSGGCLLNPGTAHFLPTDGLDPLAKWGPVVARPPRKSRQNVGRLRIGDLFAVKRGLATGANGFFILDRKRAEALELPVRFLRPILPGPRYAEESTIESNQDGFPRGMPERVLLDCDLPQQEIRRRYPALASYLQFGETKGIPNRYLPRHRTPWYRQEHRPPAPILCTYMGRTNGGRAIRFLRNRSRATAPNVYLLLYPKRQLVGALTTAPDVIDRIFEALQESASQLEQQGRVYGGGLNKIEPKELQAVRLPRWVEESYGFHHEDAGLVQGLLPLAY